MKLRTIACATAAAVSLFAPAALAHEHENQAAPKSATFEQLKQLAGDWEGQTSMGPAQISFKVTANGSTVMETMFPGTAHEMVNMYHVDGDKLVMTHYCGAGNQPHMSLDPASKAGGLHFVCSSASNLKSHNDEHMHELTLKLTDKDHFVSEWVSMANGKGEKPMSFTLTRKK